MVRVLRFLNYGRLFSKYGIFICVIFSLEKWENFNPDGKLFFYLSLEIVIKN